MILTARTGFVDTGGAITSIELPGATEIHSSEINSKGQVTGSLRDGLGQHGFLYYNGNVQEIDAPGASATQALGITNQSVI